MGDSMEEGGLRAYDKMPFLLWAYQGFEWSSVDERGASAGGEFECNRAP